MATQESAFAPDSQRMTDLLLQLRAASTPDAQRDVMVKIILAGRNNEISVTENKALNSEFVKINAAAQAHLKAERARLKAARLGAD